MYFIWLTNQNLTMKRIALPALLLLASGLHAQKVKLTWGEQSKKELEYGSIVKGSGTEMVKLCFENNGGLFSKKTVTPILARYDSRLDEKGVRSFEVQEDNVRFDNLLSVKEKLFMFTNQYDKADKATSFYAQKIDGRTLNPSGRAVNLGKMAAIDRARQSTANYDLSKDSSKVLFFGLSPYSKKENEKYYMSVYDNDMNKLWDNTVVLPYLDKFVDILDFVVTNSGNVGVILKHYDKEVKKEKVREDGANVPAYKTKILLYEKGAAKPREYVLDMNDRFVHGIQLTADENSNLTLFGLYKNKYDGYVSGYFITSINEKGDKIELKKMEAFPEDLVALVKKDKQGSDREKDPGLSAYFTLADLVQRADGSTDYLLEYYRMVWVTVTNSRGGSYSYPRYYYGDIVDVHVEAGKSTGFVRIPKMQETSYVSIFSSFKAVTANNKLVLFYNDDKDNVDRDLAKRPDDMTNFAKSVLTMAVVDSRNNLNRSAILDHRELKMTTCIRVCQKLANDRIGLYAQKFGGLFSSSKDMVGMLELN